jgi:hypothetical protein
LHPPAGLSISGDLGIPRVGLVELKLGEPRQQFFPLADGKRLHLLGDLLYAGCHFIILAPLWTHRNTGSKPGER